MTLAWVAVTFHLQFQRTDDSPDWRVSRRFQRSLVQTSTSEATGKGKTSFLGLGLNLLKSQLLRAKKNLFSSGNSFITSFKSVSAENSVQNMCCGYCFRPDLQSKQFQLTTHCHNVALTLYGDC